MRYVDGGIVFWDKRLCDFEIVFNFMNLMDPSIHFTMERGETSLKFLDVLIYNMTITKK